MLGALRMTLANPIGSALFELAFEATRLLAAALMVLVLWHRATSS